MRSISTAVTVLVLTVLVTSCSSTIDHEIATERRNQGWRPRPLVNVLVIAAYDPTYRAFAENLFVAEMAAKGVNASPGFEIFPDLDALDEASQVWETIDGAGFDGILTVVTVTRDEDFDHDDWWATYGVWVVLGGSSENTGRVLVDDYKEAEYHIDIGLFDANTREPIWNATTDSLGLAAGKEDIEILADFVVAELTQRGFVK